jgi:hypothetical protein
LLAPLHLQDFIECGNDAFKLQSLLKRSVETSCGASLSDRDETRADSEAV